MALKELDLPPGITCQHYAALPHSDKPTCQHYAGKGACALPDVFMCSEWIKRNPKLAAGYQLAGTKKQAPDPLALDDDDPLALDDDQPAQPALPLTSQHTHKPPSPQAPTGATGATGAAPRSPARSTREIEAQARREAIDRARLEAHQKAFTKADPNLAGFREPVTSEDVQALASRGYHIQLEGFGDQPLWLVPELTHSNRLELTYRDAATLANILAAFPGAHVQDLKPKDTK